MLGRTANDAAIKHRGRDADLVVALLGLFALGNCGLMFYLRQSEPISSLLARVLEPIFFGWLFAQLVLHSIWTVFSNRRMLQRTVLSGVAALLLLLSWLTPNALMSDFLDRGRVWEGFTFFIFCFPTVLLAVQAPLWLVRVGFGWKVAHPRTGHRATEISRLSIKGLLVATAAVAFCCGGLRVAAALGNTSVASFATYWALIAAALSAWSLITTVPILATALRARQLTLWLASFVATQVYVGLIVIAINRPYGPPRLRHLALPSLTLITFVVTVTIPLLIARRRGYRLQLRSDERSVSPTPAEAGT